MKIKIKKDALKALHMLENGRHEAYVVGGCVRDSLLNLAPKDWDICTSALPDEIMACFDGYKTIDTGKKHGTITVLIDDTPIEITTYRIDGDYSDYRRPDAVVFSAKLIDDLSRRDFTINAMAYHPDRGIVDYFDGQNDLNAKKIRTVGDADKRFAEDALRILRGLRFASCLGFTIEESTLAAMRVSANLLRHIAAERIYIEFSKLLCGQNCKLALDDGKHIIAAFIPEIVPMFGFDQRNPHHIYDVWQHTLHAVEAISPESALRLAAFFHDIGKPSTFSMDTHKVGHFYGHTKKGTEMATIILGRLRADNVTIETVTSLIAHHSVDIPPEKKAARKWLGRLSEERLRHLIALKKADTLAKGVRQETLNRLKNLDDLLSTIDDIIESNDCFSLKQLAINGDDLKALGVPFGPEMGQILSHLLKKVTEERIPNEKAALESAARKML